MVARASENRGNQGRTRSSIVTVASELKAEDMVLKGGRERQGALREAHQQGRLLRDSALEVEDGAAKKPSSQVAAQEEARGSGRGGG